jgi:hypothetical protein
MPKILFPGERLSSRVEETAIIASTIVVGPIRMQGPRHVIRDKKKMILENHRKKVFSTENGKRIDKKNGQKGDC